MPSLDGLEDGLLTEILIRTPLDSVHRFKLISKRWLSLICNSRFSHQYTLRKPICQHALIYQQYSNVEEFGVVNFGHNHQPFKFHKFSFSFFPEEETDRYFRLVGSCNGLVLCNLTRELFCICNPITKHWFTLSPIPSPPLQQKVGFICDNYLNPIYKIVLFPQYETTNEVKISWFCTETGNWSELYVSLPRHVIWYCHCSNVIACNGMLYGLLSDEIFIYDPFYKPKELNFIDLPEGLHNRKLLETCLEGSQGSIRLCHFSRVCDISLQVWELEDYGSSIWCFKHDINFGFILPKLPLDVEEIDIFLSVKTCKIDNDIAYICSSKYVILCNLKNEQLLNVISNPHGVSSNAFPFVFPLPTPVPCPGKLNRGLNIDRLL